MCVGQIWRDHEGSWLNVLSERGHSEGGWVCCGVVGSVGTDGDKGTCCRGDEWKEAGDCDRGEVHAVYTMRGSSLLL